MHYFLLYPLIGIVAGFLAGLLGLGGGTVIVPMLVIIFPLVGIDRAVSVHMAIATSMANVMVTQAASIFKHKNYISKQTLHAFAKQLWPGVIAGAIIGVIIADHLTASELALFFGIIVLLLALKMAFKKRPSKTAQQGEATWALPHRYITLPMTFLIGSLSSILGMGGGVFMVPFLQHYKVPIAKAMGASVLCGLPLATIATITYLIVGLDNTPHVPLATGYIYWPAFIGIAVTSMFFAPLGVKLAHRIPSLFLRWFFIIFLVIVGIKMVVF